MRHAAPFAPLRAGLPLLLTAALACARPAERADSLPPAVPPLGAPPAAPPVAADSRASVSVPVDSALRAGREPMDCEMIVWPDSVEQYALRVIPPDTSRRDVILVVPTPPPCPRPSR